MRARSILFSFAALLLLVLVGGLVGCGGGGQEVGGGEEPQATDAGSVGETTSGTTSATGEVIETIVIEETSYDLDQQGTPTNEDPVTVTLEKPGTYVFVARNHADEIGHALEVEGPGVHKETEEIPPGQSARLKVNLKPGTYDLYCPIANHKELGMDGRVKVAVKNGTTGGGANDTGSGSEESGGGSY